ncbi:metallo-beta-lactamase family protein [Clostridium botulinum CFSAN002367]|nr:metallo-beta-lactamase family protein [Clostridium botulinum CFSAN002367]
MQYNRICKKVCKDNRVLGVIGGFHLFEVNEQVNKTIDYLKQNNVKNYILAIVLHFLLEQKYTKLCL